MFSNFISKVLKLVTMTKMDMILEHYFIFFINCIILNQYLSRIFKLEKKKKKFHKNDKNIFKRFWKSNQYLNRIFKYSHEIRYMNDFKLDFIRIIMIF